MHDGAAEAEQGDYWSKHTRQTEGEFAGWWSYGKDPYEDLTGPYFYRELEDGSVECGLRCEEKHMNGGGFLHGGAAMTFADYSLFCFARKDLQGTGSVTAQLNGDFVDTCRAGDLLIARGEVVKAGGSMVFIRGQLICEDRVVFNYSAILKKVRRK